MYCKKCGKEIDNDSKYCAYCGGVVERKTKKAAKKQNYTGLIIVIVLLIVLVFGSSIFLGRKIVSYISDIEKKTTNTISDYNLSDNYQNDDIWDDRDDYYDDSSSFQSSFNNISIDDYLSLKSGNELSIIYIGRQSCNYCVQESIMLYMLASKYNLTINYLDISNISTEEYAKLQESDSYFNGNWGIPLIVLVKDNTIIDKVSGYQDANQLFTFFNNNGLLN